MSKRKQTDVDEDSADEPTPDLVDVHFDYYNIDASNDYHAVHRLFMQLFGPDAKRVQTGALTELVIRVAEESGVGSTIKTEEDEGSDPYAILTVISCRDHAGLETVIDYVLSRTRSDAAFHDTLAALLQSAHVGLVLSERLINMPVQVMGPMYRMLSEELDDAGHAFTHYLFVSRAYRLAADDARPSKRAKGDGLCAFHPEDEEILACATHSAAFDFADGDAESVGVAVAGRAMLVPAATFGALVQAVESTYPV